MKNGYLTVNEARAQLGLPPVLGGDVFIRTLAQVAEPATVQVRKELVARVESKGQAERRRLQEAIIAAQRQARAQVAGRMESALDGWFTQLADRVVGRLRKGWTPAVERKGLPDAEDLLTDGDAAELEELVKRFYLELMQISWGYYDLALGTTVAFDLMNPAVTQVLASAGTRVRMIDEATLGELRRVLQYGSEHGWSVDHLARGDTDAGIPGIRDVVAQTYEGRARAIARTELGNAQNLAAAWRFGEAGVEKVLVLDNGLDDDDEPCKEVNGTVQTVDWMRENLLEHPNCTRAFAPELSSGESGE